MTASQSPTAPKPNQPPAATGPDAQRLQVQFALLVEAGDAAAPAALVPLLQHLRSLLSARTVALLPVGPVAESEIVSVGAPIPGLAKLGEALDREKALVLPAPAIGADGYTLSVPVWWEKRLLGWLVVQSIVAQTRDLPALMVLLQSFTGYLLYREQRLAVTVLNDTLGRVSSFLEIFRKTGAEADFEQACRAALDALVRELGCGTATFAVRRLGSLRVVAISGVTHVDAKSPSHQPVEAAMAETLDAGKLLNFRPGGARTDLTAAHEILAEKTGAARILTVPLPRDEGAVQFLWMSPPEMTLEPVVEASAPFVPVLFDLLVRARPNPVVFATHRLWRQASKTRKRLTIGLTVAVAALLACPFHYRIGADCRIAPTVKQVVAAPFDGQLRKSFVRPGDTVKAGDSLGELDNRELKLKEAELIAQRERAIKQRDREMNGAKEKGPDFSAAQVANFEAQSVGQELELVRRKLALLEVKAPLDGVVVSGDLKRAEGQPVPRGQVLWEVAPLDTMIVEIDVPDREISRVRQDQPVRVRLEAFSGSRWKTSIKRIHPESEQRDSHNVFIAEADIKLDRVSEVRPGMRGRASIESDLRPLGWIIGHRFWDWLVTTFFW